MDQIHVNEQRDQAPEWARSPEAGTATQVAGEALAGEPKITANQRSYLLDLIAKKAVLPEHEGKVDLIMKCLRISEDPEEYGMSKSKASELITRYLARPDKLREDIAPAINAVGERIMSERFALNVPAGRYAVEADSGELRFYKVWISKDGARLNVYVQHGPDESDLKYQARTIGVLRKIAEVGVREAAIRYGMEIGECSNCGRRLTNTISRELGIGPICGGRMFGDDFKTEVKTKREEIRARGDDPDEEVDDVSNG